MSHFTENLQTGDAVAVFGASETPAKATVERDLPSQVIVGGRRYSRASGRQHGNPRVFIGEWTADLERSISRDHLEAEEREAVRRLANRLVVLAQRVQNATGIAFKPGRTDIIRELEAVVERAEDDVSARVAELVRL